MTSATPVTAFVGMGGNQGEVALTLDQALTCIDALPQTRIERRSRRYRTPAWGVTDQPDFINAAIALRTALPPKVLMTHLLDIERRFGRDRHNEQRWGPRTLDLDLLLYGDLVMSGAELTLPHPRMHERAFVLKPLLDIAPGLTLPGHGSIAELLAELDAGVIQALA